MRSMISVLALFSLFLVTAASIAGRSPAGQSAGGGDTYKAKCVACHGADGSGNTPMGKRMNVRDLRSAEVQKQSDEDLANIIRNGKPPMPGFAKSLDQGQIQALVAYIRSIAQKS
jgi:mono/diheme cytochrome c family protein